MAIVAKPRKSSSHSSFNGSKIWLFSLLLFLQYGAQPLISKWFIRREVIVTSSVLMCEMVKVVLAIVFMSREGTLLKSLRQWSLACSSIASGLPATIYALQNSLLQAKVVHPANRSSVPVDYGSKFFLALVKVPAKVPLVTIRTRFYFTGLYLLWWLWFSLVWLPLCASGPLRSRIIRHT